MLPLKSLTSPKSYGFTLIEVLIVIALLGSMAAVVVSLINPIGQRNKGNDAKRKADLRQVQSALEFYRTDAGAYPASLPGCNTTALSYTDAGGITTTYMAKIPCAPEGGSYSYVVGTGNVSYCLRACLQTSTDPDRDEANAKYSSTNNPTPAPCSASSVSCSGNYPKSFTVLNP